MATNGAKGQHLAKAALAKANGIIAGTTGTTDARVSPLSQSLGVTYDANKNVIANTTTARIGVLETETDVLQGKVSTLEAKLASIVAMFGIAFDANNAISSEGYTTHVHAYEDDNGTTTVVKSTSGVS